MLCYKNKQKYYKCKIILLDNTELEYKYKSSTKGFNILEDAAVASNLKEYDYFGLRYIDKNSQTQWLDLSKGVKSQFKTLDQITLYFNVKFYVSDPCKLKDEVTRYLFFMQLRQDILQGRLPVPFDYAVDLFAYILQQQLGDHDTKCDTLNYASEFEFLPNQSEELENSAQNKHLKLKGMSSALAEMNFLNKAKWLDMYGVDSHVVMGQNNMEYLIGINPTGISLYREKTKVNNYFWPRISKLDYKDTKFYLTIIAKSNVAETQVFTLGTKSACKHLWKSCIDQLSFFKLKTVYNEENPNGSPVKLNTTKYRNSVRSLNNFNSTEAKDTAKQQSFKRAAFTRLPRRTEFESEQPIIVESVKDIMGSQTSLANRDWKELENQGGLLTADYKDKESPRSVQSSLSYRCPNPRHESASEGEIGIRERKERNRQRTRSNHEKNENENRSSSRRRRHRSNSKGSTKMVNSEMQQNATHQEARIIKSKSAFIQVNSDTNQLEIKERDTCHETSIDETDFNELERKRQIRRRKRSKSPNTVKPPGELRQHIKYNLVEPPTGLSSDQLREIPFIKIETTAPAFRISPHQKHRKFSPHRPQSQDVSNLKSTIAFIKDGTANIVKTTKSPKKELDRFSQFEFYTSNQEKNLKKTADKSIENDSGCDEIIANILRPN